MLCPEVWNFDPPPSFSHYHLVKDEKELENVVTSQYFNHFVSITIPDAMQIHPSFKDILSQDSQFYQVRNLKAFELVRHDFIELFIKKGELTLLSINTHLDEDDCVCITPTRKLIFSLCRKTFQELGIEGKPSAFSNKIPEKYVVSIDMNENSFSVGKKNYKRVLERLQEKNTLCFDVILAWEPHESKICPSSIAAYFSKQGFEVKTCSVQLKQRNEYNVTVPVFDDESDGELLIEWLGAFNLGCRIPEDRSGYFNKYTCPEKQIKFGQVVYLEAVGLFTRTRLKKLFWEVHKYADTLLSDQNWIGLNVNGFEDSVVNRGNQEHFFYSSGDYHYSMLFRNEGSPLLCIHTSSSRRPKKSTKRKKKKKMKQRNNFN